MALTQFTKHPLNKQVAKEFLFGAQPQLVNRNRAQELVYDLQSEKYGSIQVITPHKYGKSVPKVPFMARCEILDGNMIFDNDSRVKEIHARAVALQR